MATSIILGLVFKDGENKGDYSTDSRGKVLKDTIVEKIIPKLSPSDHRRTLTQKDLEFHYSRVGSLTVFCVAYKDAKKRIVWNFVDEVQKGVEQMGSKVSSKNVKQLIKDQMVKWNDPKSDKITELNQVIDETKAQMVQNIDNLLDRQVKLEELVDDTDKLAQESNQFNVKAKEVKNRMLFRLIFLIILLIFIILAVIVIAIFAGCGFPSFSRCIFVNGGSLLPPPINATSIHLK